MTVSSSTSWLSEETITERKVPKSKPKSAGGEEGSDGFFASLSDLLADHPFAVLFFMLLVLLGAGGAGYALRERKEYDVHLVVDAELATKDETS